MAQQENEMADHYEDFLCAKGVEEMLAAASVFFGRKITHTEDATNDEWRSFLDKHKEFTLDLAD
jgi:hypothetical protein